MCYKRKIGYSQPRGYATPLNELNDDAILRDIDRLFLGLTGKGLPGFPSFFLTSECWPPPFPQTKPPGPKSSQSNPRELPPPPTVCLPGVPASTLTSETT